MIFTCLEKCAARVNEVWNRWSTSSFLPILYLERKKRIMDGHDTDEDLIVKQQENQYNDKQM